MLETTLQLCSFACFLHRFASVDFFAVNINLNEKRREKNEHRQKHSCVCITHNGMKYYRLI